MTAPAPACPATTRIRSSSAAARLEDMDEVALAAVARARSDPGSCAVVLVEGMSDQAAVQTLAERSGRDLNADGVFAADLEDEVIRALGTGRVEDLIEAEDESGPFLTFSRQPAHRDRARDQQLRRFMGTRSGRKIRYGHILAAALDPTLIPAPLAGLLSAV